MGLNASSINMNFVIDLCSLHLTGVYGANKFFFFVEVKQSFKGILNMSVIVNKLF